MIPRRFIDEWRSKALWPGDAQVEQDLVISRCLYEIFNNSYLAEGLAFRGGTALYKLYMTAKPRYSEDIDLVQIKPEPIRETLRQIRETLNFLGDPTVKQKAKNNSAIFKFESEIAPVQRLKLKIEINCREHFSVLGYKNIPFSLESSWCNGDCLITSFDLNELLGTKLRALYQRKKGRDLYDLYKALQFEGHDVDKILKCYTEYMKDSVKRTPSQKEFKLNLGDKMNDRDFLVDMRALLIPGEIYNPFDAYELVMSKLIDKM